MFRPLQAMGRTPEGKVLLTSALGTLGVGTVAYTLMEGWSPLDSLYFCVVTLATVGFGDYTPTTELAKLFTIGYVLVGVGILAGFVSELTKYRGEVGAARFGRAAAAGQTLEAEVDGVIDDVAGGERD